MAETIQLPKEEYEDMVDYMERLRETIDVLSSESTIKKLKKALDRMEKDEFLSKEEMQNV